ncbi:lipid IV(A) palmitoyltransferase PagP [Paludibacterium yongneupense]|uniref:lipid IV(A) palmitoyltransferase PagP n=1 Tax=Paludibacterium yongneupense TaxID=400061 RepID=UPI0009FDAD0B|nr:lipid IV(A) palmitoyltransferase PagP [Paludibacterium yongneupense]
MSKNTLLLSLALGALSGHALADDAASPAPAAATAAPGVDASLLDRATTAVLAPAGRVLSSLETAMLDTWHSDKYELYIPLHTWHNRRMYSSENIARYNENPFGLGVGKYRFDSDGNWHGLYAMAFMDSHHDVEPIAGYGYQKMWYPGGDWRLGLGYTVGVTMRQDYSYVPIPLVLPLFSIEKGGVALQSTYMPGTGKNNGNVLFTWLRWQF